jgi:hypothetical protein
MARRGKTSPAEDIMDLVAKLPWWGGVVLALVSLGRQSTPLKPVRELEHALLTNGSRSQRYLARTKVGRSESSSSRGS